MEKFSYRTGHLEVRSAGKFLMLDGEHTTAEIIEWFNGDFEGCYVLAYWKIGKEGFDLHFVGDRPFGKTVDRLTFMKLAGLGQEELNLYFNTLKKD